MRTLYTFGDSILDCGHYNDHALDPGRLLVRNDDALFPEFIGRDLSSLGPAKLEHRAVDGSTVDDLPRQVRGLVVDEPIAAIVTIGGNDLLAGLILDEGPRIADFAADLDAFLRNLPIRPVLVGNVYDPTCGDDARNFLEMDPKRIRAGHRRLNAAIAEVAGRYGRLADLHAHFLEKGDPSWFTRTIEPSLAGASEVRRVFLELLLS